MDNYAHVIEEDIFNLEKIRIVIRETIPEYKQYDYKRPTSDKMTIKDWLRERVFPLVGQCEIQVFDPTCFSPNLFISLGLLRDNYVIK